MVVAASPRHRRCRSCAVPVLSLVHGPGRHRIRCSRVHQVHTGTRVYTICGIGYPRTVDRIGVRELRGDLAALVRRAGGGERVVITVDGAPVAQLGPLEPLGPPTLDDLAAAGLVRRPGRTDRPPAPEPFAVPVDIRLPSVIAALRGEPG